MTAKINQCRDCQPKDQWIEIRLVDEMNQPFGSLSGKLKDSSGVEHQVTLSGGYLLLTDLPAGPVELKIETSALLNEAKKHKPRPSPQTSPAKEYADKHKGYEKSKIKYQFITMGDVWQLEPGMVSDRHKAGQTGKLLRMVSNNSYFLEVRALTQLHLPLVIFQSQKPMDDIKADDMQSGDMSRNQIMNLGMFKPFSKLDYEFDLSARDHFVNFRLFASSVSWGEYGSLTKMMIDRFEQNIGGKFTHPLLDQAAKSHKNTDAVVDKISDAISAELKKKSGELEDKDIKKIWNSLATGKNSIHLPGFDTTPDWFNGLGITVHGIWSLQLTLQNLSIDLVNRTFNGVVLFKAQDHFGLNVDDVNGDKYFEFLRLFRSWFILQRYKGFGYKPFITEMNHTRKISGDFR